MCCRIQVSFSSRRNIFGMPELGPKLNEFLEQLKTLRVFKDLNRKLLKV